MINYKKQTIYPYYKVHKDRCKNKLCFFRSSILIILVSLLYNNTSVATDNEYYNVLQPGIHPSAPLGHPDYRPEHSMIDVKTSPISSNDDNYKAIKEEAFQKLLDTKVPLNPEQIIKLNKELDKTQKAIRTNPNTPPQPISSTITIDLSPGTPPPLVRLSAGFVSSLVFVDSTGQPWPIGDYSLGNPQNFNIQWDKKTNALFIQSTAPYVTANLAVRLAKLDTPIMISLVTGQRDVDYRVDFQIRAHGPNALPIIGENNYSNFNMPPSLLKVLDGIPPEKSKELQVSDNLGRAWYYNDKIIFRTKLVVLSPAWNATVSSPDGTKVYEFMQTPLILASQNGKTVKIEISGF